MKKKMTPSLKQLVKDSKIFCQKESTATTHVIARFQPEALFDKNRSMESNADAMRGLSRIVMMRIEVWFLEERF